MTTYSATERRVVYNRGDFITYRNGSIGRVAQILTIDNAGSVRVFLLLDRTRRRSAIDFALNLPNLTIENTQDIVGLPAVGAEKHYIIAVEQDVGLDLRAARDSRHLLHVNWRIQFL